jgi:hypothetical protein
LGIFSRYANAGEDDTRGESLASKGLDIITLAPNRKLWKNRILSVCGEAAHTQNATSY